MIDQLLLGQLLPKPHTNPSSYWLVAQDHQIEASLAHQGLVGSQLSPPPSKPQRPARYRARPRLTILGPARCLTAEMTVYPLVTERHVANSTLAAKSLTGQWSRRQKTDSHRLWIHLIVVSNVLGRGVALADHAP